MNKYCYLKSYSSERDWGLVLRLSSLFFSFLGIILVGNAVFPVFSYQFLFSPRFNEKETISPLVSEISQESFSLPAKVLGEEMGEMDSTNIKAWFPQAKMPEISTEKISSYFLSVPKLKIFQAMVEIGGENLSKGLIHYPGTGLPGKNGNPVIFGHSVLPQFFNPKNYVTIFSTLPTLVKGDQIFVDYNDVRYVYLVEELKEVSPNDVEILAQKHDDAYLTLVTCVPPGTYLRRLVVRARLTKI